MKHPLSLVVSAASTYIQLTFSSLKSGFFTASKDPELLFQTAECIFSQEPEFDSINNVWLKYKTREKDSESVNCKQGW